MVVVGGGLASAWDLFAPALFESVRRFSVVYRLAEPSQRAELEPDHTYIRPAMLGPSAGLLGAGILPWLQGAPAEELSAVGMRADA
jgi:glucokinase